MRFMPPNERTIEIPEGGWKETAYYIIEAAFSPSNPVHRYIFFTGFLNGGKWDPDYPDQDQEPGVPGGYNGIFNNGDKCGVFTDLHYCKLVHIIAVDDLHTGPIPYEGEFNIVGESYNPYTNVEEDEL